MEAQRHEQPRAAVVAEIEQRLLELYRDPSIDTKPELLEQRGGAFYSEAATQLLTALFSDSGETLVVDTRNGETLGRACRGRCGRVARAG